ncbi:CGNR zinc finger domain-containing protein [Acidipropionibacterium virtanenii]|uniref:CGNR zinc finger domain-containing protein n=1 Tax=Acidipropionibacterium virtanenii TaxID=2057246 RepID=UPI001FE3A2B5|nr:CGNR zinc finger domain-containing protein [Acidipropionibacterium virtanenii]
MAEDAGRVFRLDNEVLAFRFTATLSHRASTDPLERLTSPERLRLWLGAAGLDPGPDITEQELAAGVRLREAIHRVGRAISRGRTWAAGDCGVLNATSEGGRPAAVLTAGGRSWRLSGESPVRDAFSVVAQDAIAVFGTQDAGRIKTCDGPGCGGLFLDTSRGGNRRWCSMNTCGNRVKKLRMVAR